MKRLLFISCTNVGRAMIETIVQNKLDIDIIGIVNLSIKNAMNKANYDSYQDLALKYNIPIHYCDNVNDEITLEWIKKLQPDLIIQSGWSQKFGDEILNIPKYGCIGEHPAPLPRGRGAACVNWAILSGEKLWGDSFFEMVQKYDKGKVVAQKNFIIEDYDTVKTVYDKVALASGKIVLENIETWCEGNFSKIEQDESLVTYYKKRTPENGEFNFNMKSRELYNFIRAQTRPYPCAFFQYKGKKISVVSANLTTKHYENLKIGDIVEKTNNGGVVFVCGDNLGIEICRIMVDDGIEQWLSECIDELSGGC